MAACPPLLGVESNPCGSETLTGKVKATALDFNLTANFEARPNNLVRQM